jgi:dipeptidyl aminopeptidase/acylaminoacyl peptidase
VWNPPETARITVATHDNLSGRNIVAALSLRDGTVSTLLDTEENIGGANVPYGFAVSPERTQVAFFAENAEHPPDLWLADSSFGNRRRITTLNPGLSEIPLGPAKLLKWEGPAGQSLRGGLLLPPDYDPGKRYPMIVWVYGGVRQSRDMNRFGMSRLIGNALHLFATRGYVVLLPDAPLRKGRPAADILECVMPGVDRAISEGYADPDRIGVMGNSYGGYSTLALIVQTTRFRAAVASAPLSNLIFNYLDLGPSGESYGIMAAEEGNLLMGGTLWDFRDRYIENSPVFHLDKVKTPLLLLHGDQDTAAKITHSEEVFAGLRRLGAEVEFVRYAGEGHGIRFEANLVDYWQRAIAWFDSHLRRP